MNISDFSDSVDASSGSEEEVVSDTPLQTEPNPEQKREIARWVAEGMGLSDVQKKINTDFGLVMTYIDVRFLVDDLDLTLADKEEEKPKEVPGNNAETPGATDELNPTEGGVY